MIKNSAILIDTCILSNLLSKEESLAGETNDLMQLLYQDGNKFYISEFSKYELLRGASETQCRKANSILNAFTIVENSDERLERATALHSGYSSISRIKNSLHSISDVDVFIGALIFTEQQPYLLTADYFDFPRPFFLEKKVWNIDFKKKKGNRSSIHYYLLQANLNSLFK